MTAVEWLLSELKKYGNTCPNYDINYIIDIPTHILTELEEQAKEMEKEQIQDAFIFSKDPFGLSIGNSHTIKKAEEYYNITFKSE